VTLSRLSLHGHCTELVSNVEMWVKAKSASEMTSIVSRRALNSTDSVTSKSKTKQVQAGGGGEKQS